MQFEWFVCLRYLKAKRKHGFISLISLISIAGVMVGVMALIVVLAVMTGFTSEFRDKILGINSHVVVQDYTGNIRGYEEVAAKIRAVEGVSGVTPYLYSQAMITSGEGGTGAVLRGLDPATAPGVLSLAKHLRSGSIAALSPVQTEGRALPGIILGKELAAQLHVSTHDRVRLISASGPLTPMGVIPKVSTCQVVGVFETGMYEYDSALAYVSLETAQRFFGLPGAVHGLEVKTVDLNAADQVAKRIEHALGPNFYAKDWMRMNRNIFSALALEKTALSVIMALVVMVAAFNIVSTLIMVVMEKNKDIAILKSMGATSGSIMRIFIYEGLVIGLVGTTLGVLGGLGLCAILSRYQFIKLPDVYPISTLPVLVLPSDVLLIALSATVITLLATLYPSWQAAKIDPAVALRYE
ncbi:lipoprotein-releasing ABC transporter permease subunit [Thiovibrio frasassiensis]|uniref:Lipoprotein-releasing ABC transporter permease subunit n=1 Tax=Thiovibrio frasassiensis TaxID=2984131 RepID=A0A9X4MFN9_9BACT|nr:lipoprotein-releasing ABC transporter permease subunit [Thiovibrio frasassiensis]MDG4476371.1 lipoprotein-releasing ABC transporter permease subunit [Thiovibrio frasassiensis]